MKIKHTEFFLIDTHVHLNLIEPVQSAISNAVRAGVNKIIAVGMDMESNINALSLARQYPEIIYPAVGYHPWSIKEEETGETLSFIDTHLKDCRALGEVGLDYKVKIKKSLQHNVFSQVLALAEKYKKPVIVHSRYSYEKTYEMVSAANIKKAVFHWYSGPLDVLEKIIDAGYFISATPALAYSEKHQEAVLKAPLDQILIETDSPVEYQGKLSEPATLIETIAELSKLKKEPIEIIAEITTKNAKWFFDI